MVGNIYLIYGDDEYIKNRKIKEIQKKCNVDDSINKIDLNGEEWEEIYDELTLPTFLSSNKIITIYQAETNIFSDKIDSKKISKKNKLYSYITKIVKKADFVKICECNKLPKIENEKYLLDIAKEKNLNISMNEIKFLAELVDKNTYVQVNELMKLCFLNKAILRRKDYKR